MANPKHLEILKQGVETWNEWRKSRQHEFPDLSGAELVRTSLSGASLVGVSGVEPSKVEPSKVEAC
jgi:hypothetical protein